jgi:hypothetical protein
MRNRKQRRSADIYKVVPYMYNQANELVPMGEYNIEGEIGDWLVVSVPEEMSASYAGKIRDDLMKRLSKPVMILSHNIQFCSVQKLGSGEAARLVADMERTSGLRDGGGSGVRVDGSGGAPDGQEQTTGVSRSALDQDEEEHGEGKEPSGVDG